MRFPILTKKYNLWNSIATKWLILAMILLNRQCLQAAPGLLLKDHFKEGDIEYDIEYRITGSFPIEIKRMYPDGSTELIVLQQPHPEDAKALYNLVKGSRSDLQDEKIPGILKTFGESEEKTALAIKRMPFVSQRTGRLDLFIYFKGKKDDKPRIAGHVAWHSYNNYKPGSVDGMIWRGIHKIIPVKHIGSEAMQALFHHAAAIGIKYLNMVMIISNIRSLKMAKELGMKQIDPNDYKKWGYAHKKEDVYAFSLSAEEWKAIHWKNQSKKSKL